ncbi:hypothetical protein [Halalkalicoccus paucihalophilus]|nr:hypothetical protein [Halalkalicoccus paucihalophilus]
MKIGLELEYWIAAENGALTSADTLIEAHEHAVPECVDTLIELVLPPAITRTELEKVIVDSITELIAIAADNNRLVVPLDEIIVLSGIRLLMVPKTTNYSTS